MKFKLFSKKIAAVSLAVVLATGSFAVSAAQGDAFVVTADNQSDQSAQSNQSNQSDQSNQSEQHVCEFKVVASQPANFEQYGVEYAVCTCGKANFKVTPKLKASLNKTTFTYTGKSQKVTATVKTVTGTKVACTQSSKTVKSVGAKAITIKVDKAPYDCSTVKTVTVNPAKSSISKLTAAKKAFTVKVKKGKGASKVKVYYSTDKKFKKGVKAVYVTSSKKITGLKSKKTYYVRVRSYKTVSGKNYVSGYSAVKKIKTK